MFSEISIPREGAALLSLVRASLSATPVALDNFPSSLDWSFLQRLARHHRLGPLLSYGLRRSRFNGIPAALRAEWNESRRTAMVVALHHQEALREVAAALEDRPVPFILLKGEALSKTVYPQDGLRPYGDIDLLIQPEAYEEAKTVLTDLGYRLRQPAKESEKRQLFGEIEFEKQGPITVTVDLHWDTLMASWEPRSLFGEPETWASVDRIRLGDRALPVLDGEALLLYLCVHLAFHHVFDGLLLLCDIFLVLRRSGERIDWDSLAATATRCGCRHALYYSLLFVERLMAGRVPSEILDGLRPPTLIRALMPSNHLLFRDNLAPQMLERYVKFLLIDTQEGRWRAAQTWLGSSKRVLGR